jgi:hypothetical protein
MVSRYGHAWISQFGTTPGGFAAAEWAETLAGIDTAQMLHGIAADKARASEWPPSSTGFLSMCLDIPSLPATRDEITGTIRSEWQRTPFARLVWQKIDSYRFRHSTVEQCDRMIADAYELAKTDVLNGVPLPDPAAGALEHKQGDRAPRTESIARVEMAKISQMLGV